MSTLDVPGVRSWYEVSDSGPLLKGRGEESHARVRTGTHGSTQRLRAHCMSRSRCVVWEHNMVPTPIPRAKDEETVWQIT